jgi:hypothetical protein
LKYKDLSFRASPTFSKTEKKVCKKEKLFKTGCSLKDMPGYDRSSGACRSWRGQKRKRGHHFYMQSKMNMKYFIFGGVRTFSLVFSFLRYKLRDYPSNSSVVTQAIMQSSHVVVYQSSCLQQLRKLKNNIDLHEIIFNHHQTSSHKREFPVPPCDQSVVGKKRKFTPLSPCYESNTFENGSNPFMNRALKEFQSFLNALEFIFVNYESNLDDISHCFEETFTIECLYLQVSLNENQNKIVMKLVQRKVTGKDGLFSKEFHISFNDHNVDHIPHLLLCLGLTFNQRNQLICCEIFEKFFEVFDGY